MKSSRAFVKDASKLALKEGGDLEKLLAAPMGSSSVQQTLTELVAKIGENMSVRRAAAMSVNPGVVAAYVHNAASPELGKIGVLVGLKSTADKDKLSALAKQLAMHVAAAAPLALTPEHLAQGCGGARMQCPERDRAPVGQARSRRREDDGRPDAQILRRDGADAADLRDRRRNPDRQADRKGVQGSGRPGRDRRLCPLPGGRGHRKGEADFADEVAQMAGTRSEPGDAGGVGR